MIDESTDFGRRAGQHLRDDEVLWLTTVTPGGQPVPNPVSFFWDGADSIRIYTLPGSLRVKTIEANPKVSLNFRGRRPAATSWCSTAGPPSTPTRALARARGVHREVSARAASLKLTPEAFAQQYSVAVDVRITKVRGF